MLQCFLLGDEGLVCDLQITASKLRQRGGAHGPLGGEADRKGTSVPDRNVETSRKSSEPERPSGEEGEFDGLRAGRAGNGRKIRSRSGRPSGMSCMGLKPFGGIGSKKASGRVGNGTLQRPRLSTWRLLLFRQAVLEGQKATGANCLSQFAPLFVRACIPRLRTYSARLAQIVTSGNYMLWQHTNQGAFCSALSLVNSSHLSVSQKNAANLAKKSYIFVS